jgi:Mn2+-dependent serine/threonine protein kinase
VEDTTVTQRYRTDQVDVPWMKTSPAHLELPSDMVEKGAEANIYPREWMGHEVLMKERISKSYRIEEIDHRLRKRRTKGEAKLLHMAKTCGVTTPLLYDIDKDNKTITMEFIKGKPVKDVFNESNLSKIKPICKKIGEKVARLHGCGIIHGDLTSSNLLLKDDEIVFIDFGLGKISNLVEDKGTDLLVFKKALTGIHYDIAEDCFQSILEGYSGADDYRGILEKIGEIEVRRRYIENK